MPPRSSINTFYTVSLDVDDHLHVAVARSAEVIADGDEPSRRLRRDRHHRLMIGREIEIDFQIFLVEAVIAIERGYMQRHRLAAFERELVRCEFESLRGDRNLARGRVLRANRKRRGDDEDESHGSLHRNAPLEICWTPSVP